MTSSEHTEDNYRKVITKIYNLCLLSLDKVLKLMRYVSLQFISEIITGINLNNK